MDTSQLEPGLPSVDYYAPEYRVEVDGQEISPDTKGDVLQLQVTMQQNSLSSFSLTVNNWDDGKLTFKHSDGDTFFIGRKIHIQMGYADRLVSMVRGQITSMTPKFPESGASTLNVSGTDSMFRLKGSKPQNGDKTSFVKMTDWEIAQVVAKRNGLRIVVTKEGPQHERVVQERDQDDARFLLDRARRIDFDVFMQTDPKSGEDTLHFVKPLDGRDSGGIRVFEFEWGKSLIDFSPHLTVSNQVSSVTVRGWDPTKKQKIVATATKDDLPRTQAGGTSGPAAVGATSTRTAGKQDFIVDAAVISQEEAKRLAVARLVEKAYTFNTGSGRVIGLPDLRPGNNVDLLGLGKRFSGRYYATKVDHTIGSSGFQTRFDVKRLTEGSKS